MTQLSTTEPPTSEPPTRRLPTRRTALLAALAGLSTIAVAGSQVAVSATATAHAAPVPAAPGSGLGSAITPEAASFRSVRTYPEVPPPVRLRIPNLQVDTPLQNLGQTPERTIEVPGEFGVAGWFAGGPRPGQAGPAVILGHVDSTTGPAVFYRLAGIAIGAAITVQRADGSAIDFRVSHVEHVPKTEFPTSQVYGASLQPSLRLVTCGGRFDLTRHSYVDNVIVYAELAP